jgi:hypothetical protein
MALQLGALRDALIGKVDGHLAVMSAQLAEFAQAVRR